MSYLFSQRSDGQPGCCRCGVAIDTTYTTGSTIMGPPVYADADGWKALCVPCFQALRKEQDHESER